MKRVLVTEVNSQSDQQLVAYLLSQNFIVRILAESIGAGNALLRLPVEIYPGNLSDAAAVARSAKGCDYIIQTPSANGGDTSIKECICHLHKTMNVMEAACMAGIKTMLHITEASLMDNTNSQIENVASQCEHLERKGVRSLPLVEQMLSGTAASGMKIILVQTSIAAAENAANNFDGYAREIVRILKNGKHANTYVIGNLKPRNTIHWRKRLQGYFDNIGSKKILLAKNWNTSRWAFNINKLFGPLVWYHQVL